MRCWGRVLLVACVALALLAPPAFAQGSPSNPPPPPEANDPCRPGQDPTPVVLVHGTFANRFVNFINLSPWLERAGYCVFALNYGDCNAFGSCGTGRIQASARELEEFVARVRRRTGARRVSIVGHSQGGLMPRYYIKFLGGDSEVEDMIGVAGSNHGTDNLLAPFSQACEACLQQNPYMSRFTRRVNKGDETPGNVDYTQIQTRFDEVVVPYFSAFLTEAASNNYNGPRTKRMNGPSTTNFCLQDRFPSTENHLTIIGSPNTFRVIRNALRREGPAEPPATADTVCARFGGDPGGPRGGEGGGDPPMRPRCTKSGTPGHDAIRGTRGNDVICAGAGNDTVRGEGGDDIVLGGAGHDVLRGDEGSDRLFGEAGNDALNARDGASGNDAGDGGPGSDGCAADSGDRLTGCP